MKAAPVRICTAPARRFAQIGARNVSEGDGLPR
jgi:hypothetical protein